ncbi:MAG TPA: hypothetical protein VFW71_07840 [Actinomycetota bacterium]|nr:hypothetical protein [Actinomycetota bacterium]
MSLRANEPEPTPLVPVPMSTGRRILLIAGVISAILIVGVGVAAAFGKLQLPFVGKPTVTQEDSLYGWTITFPREWAKQKAPIQVDTIRFESDGDGVGVRVQAQFLKEPVNAARAKTQDMQKELNTLEGPNASGRPDATIISGPDYGTINGAVSVHYIVDFTDFSSGVPVKLQDSDYFIFNGANLEIVTLECDKKNFAKHQDDFEAAIKTFHSRHMVEGVTPTPSPGATPSVTGTAGSAPLVPVPSAS